MAKGNAKKQKLKTDFSLEKKEKKTFEGWRRQSIPPITLTVAGGIARTETETKINCTSEKLYVDRLFTPRKSCWMKIIFEIQKGLFLSSVLSVYFHRQEDVQAPGKKIKIQKKMRRRANIATIRNTILRQIKGLYDVLSAGF